MIKLQCLRWAIMEQDTNYCEKCGLKKEDSSQPIAPAAPNAKRRSRKTSTDTAALKAKGRPKKEIIKQENKKTIKKQPKEEDGEPEQQKNPEARNTSLQVA